MRVARRDLLALIAALAARPALGGLEFDEGSMHAFSRDWLEAEAERLSQRPFEPAPLIPEGWRELTYDQYRKMWFNPAHALWADATEPLPFRVDLLHPGLFYPRAVAVNVVENGEARRLRFDASLFDRTDQFPDLPIDHTMGYSGLRLRGELEQPGVHTEVAVFQGASYFRAIGRGMNYGLSARGLAIGTASAEGEEFPEFTAFWLETPQPGDQSQVLHALLDGPSVTGAYTFEITPGGVTEMRVDAVLFPRVDLPDVGIAPLTSMFLFDQTNRAGHDDFRPAVHDSDGLLIHNGAGELLIRPLKNPSTLEVSSFIDRAPRGFGLVQRARQLSDFEDFEANYHLRPSLWITPMEDWEEGAVQLVEIPSELEVYDNIVAYWRPRAGLSAGQPHRFSYRMDWCDEPARPRDVARVLNTAIGGNWDRSDTLVAIDFEAHPSLEGDLSEITPFLRATPGNTSEGVLERHPDTGGLRFTFALDPGEAPLMELRAQLFREGEAASEVWLYRWSER